MSAEGVAGDPKFDQAAGGVVAALTCYFTGDPAGAERELDVVKAVVPDVAIDFMAGCLFSFIRQLAESHEVEPMTLVQQMGLNVARLEIGEEL